MKNFTVITGANSGIGRAIALKAASSDYSLLLLDLKTNQIEKDLKNYQEVIFKKVDVTNYIEFEDAIKVGEKKFGPIKNMVNCAGIMNLERIDLQDVKTIVRQNEININGVIFGTKIALKSMLQHNFGTILNIASIAGINIYANHADYVATKFAIRGFSETVRAEVAEKGIRVALISPGIVKTNLLDGTTNLAIKKDYEDDRDKHDSFIEAKDIANTAFFILEQPQKVTIREIVICPTTQTN